MARPKGERGQAGEVIDIRRARASREAESLDLKAAKLVAARDILAKDAKRVIVDLANKQLEWQRELTQLRGKGVLIEEETERAELLEQRIKKADVIQDRIYALKKRDAARQVAAAAAKIVAENEKALRELEETRRAESAEAERATKAAASQWERITRIEETRAANFGNLPSDQLQQLAELPKTIASLETESERRTRLAARLFGEMEELQTKIRAAALKRDAALERIRDTTVRAAELALALETMESVDMEGAAVTLGVKARPAEKSAPIAAPKPPEKPVQKKTTHSAWGAFGKGAATFSVASFAAVAGAVAATGRIVETFFKRLYDLTMNPKKFFREFTRQFEKRTAQSPEGKGKIVGSLSAIGWFFVGEPLPKKAADAHTAGAYRRTSQKSLMEDEKTVKTSGPEREEKKKEDPPLSDLSWLPRELVDALEEEGIETLGELKKAFFDQDTRDNIKGLIKKHAKDKAKEVEEKLRGKTK